MSGPIRKDSWKCDSCKESIIKGSYYTFETANRTDLWFCSKCSSKWGKKIRELIKLERERNKL